MRNARGKQLETFFPTIGSGNASFPIRRRSSEEEPFIGDRLTWEIIPWLHSITSLPILLKGILTAEDAELALSHGAAGLIISNHGGRQLDGVVASMQALPEVVEAVAGRCEVFVDGAVRRGTDVLKALAYGARAVLLGRPILWGLAASGERGVYHVLQLLRAEFERAMILSGCPTVEGITRSLIPRRSKMGRGSQRATLQDPLEHMVIDFASRVICSGSISSRIFHTSSDTFLLITLHHDPEPGNWIRREISG